MPDSLKSQVLVRIVDDDAGVRQSLSFMLRCKGWKVETFADARAFLLDNRPSEPGCLLLDIRMPGMSGIELQQEMRAARAALPIIFVTGHADVETAVHTLKAGALDFLQKPVDGARLAEAVENACRISLARSLGRLTPAAVTEAFVAMSEREKEITLLLLQGGTNRDIAERLKLSERTVQGHRNNIYRKLRVHNLQEFLDAAKGADISALSPFPIG